MVGIEPSTGKYLEVRPEPPIHKSVVINELVIISSDPAQYVKRPRPDLFISAMSLGSSNTRSNLCKPPKPKN